MKVSFLAQSLARQPVFRLGFKVGIACAACTAAVKHLHNSGRFGPEGITDLLHNTVFSSFTLLISLFIAFRASQAYTRFWQGALSLFIISADFYDVASSLVAFSRNSSAGTAKVAQFRQLIVRLFSMLHALVLADLESEGQITGHEEAFKYELIDVAGIDSTSMQQLKHAGNRQIDLVFTWLQSLIVEGQQSGVLVVPAPILSRVFQELNAGIMEYHKTLSLAEVPFPVPYTAATHVVLVLHWLLTPIMASTWSTHVWSAALIAFVQVFMLWSLNGIAQELENPFGGDLNDLDTGGYHRELNERLIFLLGTAGQGVPMLSPEAVVDPDALNLGRSSSRNSLLACLSEAEEIDGDSVSHESIFGGSLIEAPKSQCGISTESRSEPATPGASLKSVDANIRLEQSKVERQPVPDQHHEDVTLEGHQDRTLHSNVCTLVGSPRIAAVPPPGHPASDKLPKPRCKTVFTCQSTQTTSGYGDVDNV